MNDVTVLIPIHRDGRRDWLQQAVNSFPEGTKILVLENDGEVAKSFNEGLRAADTEWVLPFGSDDLAGRDFLKWLLSHTFDADVVYPSMFIVSEDLKDFLGHHDAVPFCPHRLLERNYISGASLIRREKALEVGGFRELRTEDWDLWVRMLRAGARFKPCPQARMMYRQHDQSRRPDGSKDLTKLTKKIVGKQKPVKATFYNQATPATTYVRCQVPAKVLPGIVRPDWVMHMNEDRVEFPEHHGAAIWQFAASRVQALTMLHMQQRGIRTLVETDDNYLVNPGKAILARQGWGMKIGDEAYTRDGHRNIVGKADGMIVTTPYLAEQYRELNPNVFVCPNGVDPDDWPEPVKPDDGILRIVWFASQSHEGDIGIVTRALEWASSQPDVEIVVVGLDPMKALNFKQRWRFPFGHVPWVHDLARYRHLFQGFDIGIAPVSRDPMGLGRSDLKALEYAMGLCAPVLMDARPYDSWSHGENCLKADGSEGFLGAIKHLVSHRDEVPQLAQAARDYTLRERTNVAQRHCWEEAIAE